MKKIKSVLTLCCVCIAILFLLTACAEKLSSPTTFRMDQDTLTLHWNKIKNAVAYTIEIDNVMSITTRDTSFCLEDLAPGEYVVKVRAVTYSDDVKDSDVAEYRFIRERESGLRYKLNSMRTAYELVGIGSASGDVVMEDTYRGKPVTSIAKGALRRCNRITSFTIGNNVETIYDNAFYTCTELTKVVIPEGVTFLGNAVFQSCGKLEEIVLPDSVVSIGDYCFSLCKGLKKITFGANLESIGSYAFSDCVMLEDADISDKVVSLGEFAFSGCTALTDVRLGDALQTIGQYAFYNCINMQNVTVGNQLRQIQRGAFQLSGLTAVTLPDSLTIIEREAFANCRALASVTVGKGLQSVGREAFADTAILNDLQEDVLVIGDWIVCVKNSTITDYRVPENVIGIADMAFAECNIESIRLDNIQYIGEAAFYYCPDLWEVIIGDQNIEIGPFAFCGCKYLRSVKLGNSLERIGDYAFIECEKLEDSGINLPQSLKVMGYGVFNDTRLFSKANDNEIVYVDDWVVGAKTFAGMLSGAFIKEGTRGIANYAFQLADVTFTDGMVYIADTVEYIGNGAFYLNQTLTHSNLPANLKRLGDYAYADCHFLWMGNDGIADIPQGCEYIGNHAFRSCALLLGVKIPGSVKYIGDSAFKWCTSLGYSDLPSDEAEGSTPLIGTVTFAEGITHIGPNAFYGCNRIQKITLPDSLQELGSRAFYKCSTLEEVHFGNGLVRIEPYTFYDCTTLTRVTIPGNVQSVGKYAFRGCTALESVTMERGVENVEAYAFYRCEAVRYLTIPESVRTIGDFAFRGMTQLQSIYLGSQLESVGKLAFQGAFNATIYYEGSSIPAGWSSRWNAGYLPVVFGAELSEDHSFVQAWTGAENGIANLKEEKPLMQPSREGYRFVGWSTDPGSQTAQYAMLTEVPDAIKVYAVWQETLAEEIPAEPEQ